MATKSAETIYEQLLGLPEDQRKPSQQGLVQPPLLSELKNRILSGESSGNPIRDSVVITVGVDHKIENLVNRTWEELLQREGETAIYITRSWSNVDFHLDPIPFHCSKEVAIWRIVQPVLLSRDPNSLMRSGRYGYHDFGFWMGADKGYASLNGECLNFMPNWTVHLRPEWLTTQLPEPPGFLGEEHKKDISQVGKQLANLHIGTDAVTKFIQDNRDEGYRFQQALQLIRK